MFLCEKKKRYKVCNMTFHKVTKFSETDKLGVMILTNKKNSGDKKHLVLGIQHQTIMEEISTV